MKNISVSIAGQDQITDLEVSETTTARDVLSGVGFTDFELSPAVGLPPFGKDELIYDRVKPGGKIIASPPADAGA